MAISLDNISKGRIPKGLRLGVYGEPGVGKTTLVSQAKKPIFADLEGGSYALNVERFEGLDSLDQLYDAIFALKSGSHDYNTLVIDSLSSLEDMISLSICAKEGWKNISDPAYGKGFAALKAEFLVFLNELESLQAAKNMNVIFVAHSQIKTFANPSGGDYDRYEIDADKRIVNPMRKWLDLLLFAEKEKVVKDGKAVGEKRVLHTTSGPAFEAKCRENMKPKVDMNWDSFISAFKEAMK